MNILRRFNRNHQHNWSQPYAIKSRAQSEWFCLDCGKHQRSAIIF
jgi:hypothetical protein